MAALAKLTDLKALLGDTESAHDAEMLKHLERATVVAEQLAGRPLLRAVDVTEYPQTQARSSRLLWLARFPVESIESVKELGQPSKPADFEAATALVEDEDFSIDADRGRLERFFVPWMACGPRHAQVIYTAGYIDPATVSPPEGSIQAPLDLQQGILLEAQQTWIHRNTGGVEQMSLAGGGSYMSRGLKPHVKLEAACKALWRIVL